MNKETLKKGLSCRDGEGNELLKLQRLHLKLFIPESEWGNLMAEGKQNGMSFWHVLGLAYTFYIMFSGWKMKIWKEKYKSFAQRSTREQEVANLFRKVEVLTLGISFDAS